MIRVITVFLMLMLVLVCPAQIPGPKVETSNIVITDRLDGAYDFVSESVELTRPSERTYKRESPQWKGLWQFHNGFFTCVLMKGRRPLTMGRKGIPELGFESFAGTYVLEGDSIRLEQSFAISPLDVGRSRVMSYQVNGDLLILRETLYPHVEDLRDGVITTVLRKLN